MKYEKLNNGSNNKKVFLYGFITCAILLIIFNFFMSYAKYKSIDSVKLASGTITYSSADLNIIAMYKKDDDNSEYEPVDTIPTSGYTIDNNMSYCKEPGNEQKMKNILNYENGILSLKYSKKGTKCYLYFINLSAKTLANLFNDFTTAESGTNFEKDNVTGILKVTGIDTEDNGNTLYKAEDNDGTSYFFRGKANNNWVQFAGNRWRIIRINGDGTIRIIFQCEGESCKDTTGEKTNAELKVSFNNISNDNTYEGFYYGKENGETYEETHTSLANNPSTVAKSLKAWYENNLTNYEQYIDQNAGFCNDRQVVTGVDSSFNGTGIGTIATSYAAYGRVVKKSRNRQEQLPTLKCGVSAKTADEQEISVAVDDTAYARDLFTKEGASKGNGILPYPIGLITADEVVLAGGYYGVTNSSYYLYTNHDYWTMSPAYYIGGASVFEVSSNEYLSRNGVGSNYGVRPVINLKANITFSGGTGSVDDPFVVATN